MKWIRVLGIILIISLCANLYLAFFQVRVPGEDLREISDRMNLLEAENTRLSMQVDRDNITIEGYRSQLDLYRERLQELTGLTSATREAPGGTAVLQAPAVTQRIEYSGNGPFATGRIVEEGAMLNITAEVMPGKGRVLVETKPLMGLVFQDAANTAVLVAQNRTGIPLSGSDAIFSIMAPSEVPAVDGPSAGALMTLLVISALEGRPLQGDVTLTGTIDKDGNIGAIGGIVEKARAAKAAGKSLLLIPGANARLVQYTPETREYYGFTVIRQVPTTVDAKTYIESTIGVPVRYVDTIDEVLEAATAAG